MGVAMSEGAEHWHPQLRGCSRAKSAAYALPLVLPGNSAAAAEVEVAAVVPLAAACAVPSCFANAAAAARSSVL